MGGGLALVSGGVVVVFPLLMRQMILTLTAAVVLGGSIQPIMASGSYPGAGIRPASRVIPAKYELGKTIFNGKATLNAGAGDAEAQRPILQGWQKALPASAAKGVDLPALAGKLTGEQIDALQHFLEIRYGLKKAAQ